jgi:hypothetical protein
VKVTPFFSLTLPVWVGANATSTVHIPKAAIEGSQLSPVFLKGGETTTPVTVIASVLDLLVTVMVCGALVRVTVSFPKLSFLCEKDSIGALDLVSGFSACAIAGRANEDTRNNDKQRPAISRTHDLERIIDLNPRSVLRSRSDLVAVTSRCFVRTNSRFGPRLSQHFHTPQRYKKSGRAGFEAIRKRDPPSSEFMR